MPITAVEKKRKGTDTTVLVERELGHGVVLAWCTPTIEPLGEGCWVCHDCVGALFLPDPTTTNKKKPRRTGPTVYELFFFPDDMSCPLSLLA